MTSPAAALDYFEDLEVGKHVETPGMTVTQAHVDLYRGLAGETGAAETVPALILLCLCTGLGWRIPRRPPAILAFIAVEWEMLRDLAVGDTIRSRSYGKSKRAFRDAGIVIEEQEIVDQRGEVIQRGRFTFLIAKRPAPAAP